MIIQPVLFITKIHLGILKNMDAQSVFFDTSAVGTSQLYMFHLNIKTTIKYTIHYHSM